MAEPDVERDNVVSKLAEAFEIVELNKFLQDSEVEEAIDKALAVVAKPFIPAQKAAVLVVYFQGVSMLCKEKGLTYGYVLEKNADNTKRKGIYNTLSTHFHELAQSMKYLANI